MREGRRSAQLSDLTLTRQATGYPRSFSNSSSALPAPGESGSSCGGCFWQRLGRDPERARGDSSINAVEKRGGSWKGRKVLASGFLELGFHNNASYSFSLGRPHLCELETETVTIHPPHHGPINTHWPLLVVKKQGQAERRADLHLGTGRRLTPSRRKIKDRRLALEVILSKKNRRQLRLSRRPRRSAIAASWSELEARLDLGSCVATNHVLSLNHPERKSIDHNTTIPDELSAHLP